MPTPTTAIEVSMMMREFEHNIDAFRNQINETFFVPLWKTLQKRMFLQRPYTDDMMQMLVDLGIEPPEKHLINYDTLKFEWRH